MRAVQVTRPDGPSAISIEEVPEPTAEGPFGPQVLVDVHAVGISFPDLLLSKGEYQLKPSRPSPSGRLRRVVRSAPEGSGRAEGQRSAGLVTVALRRLRARFRQCLPAPDELSFEAGCRDR